MSFSLRFDHLNPMLVRDLRQGLRARIFTVVFLFLQGGMAFFVVLGLSSVEERSLSEMLNYTLWIGLTMFYIFGLPLVATSSLAPEFHDNRLDLLKLTQMNARTLMLGKWLSLVTQGWLVAVSVLPYIVLSYFFGSVDLASELARFGLMLEVSALLVGLGLAISGMNSKVMWGLVLILFLFLLFQRGVFAFFLEGLGLNNGRLMTLSYYGDCALILALAGLPLLWLCLEFGAARLAPAAENHDTPQRLLLPLLLILSGLAICPVVWKVGPGFLGGIVAWLGAGFA